MTVRTPIRSVLVIGIAAVLAVPVVGSAFADEVTPSDQAAITAAIRHVVDLRNNGDFEGLVANSCGQLTSDLSETTAEAFRAGLEPNVVTVVDSVRGFDRTGPDATAVATVHDEGAPAPVAKDFLIVLQQQQDGDWKVCSMDQPQAVELRPA